MHPRRISDEITVAVPVLLEDTVLGAVVIRFAEKAVPFKVAVERFVPKLRDAAQKIRQTFAEQRRNPPHRHSAQSAQLG